MIFHRDGPHCVSTSPQAMAKPRPAPAASRHPLPSPDTPERHLEHSWKVIAQDPAAAVLNREPGLGAIHPGHQGDTRPSSGVCLTAFRGRFRSTRVSSASEPHESGRPASLNSEIEQSRARGSPAWSTCAASATRPSTVTSPFVYVEGANATMSPWPRRTSRHRATAKLVTCNEFNEERAGKRHVAAGTNGCRVCPDHSDIQPKWCPQLLEDAALSLSPQFWKPSHGQPPFADAARILSLSGGYQDRRKRAPGPATSSSPPALRAARTGPPAGRPWVLAMVRISRHIPW